MMHKTAQCQKKNNYCN